MPAATFAAAGAGQRDSSKGCSRVQAATLLTWAAMWRWAAAALLGVWLAAGTAAAQGLPSVVAKVRQSIVPVGTFDARDSPRFGFRGTGFVVGDGTLVATNFHVLPLGAELDNGPVMTIMVPRAGAQDDRAELRRARVVNTDRARDLALLRIEGAPLPALVLDEPDNAREGQSIALLGFPIGGTLGFAPVTHRGIIASITTAALPASTAQQLDPRALLRLREGNYPIYQLDATAYPGNSGGPVVDADTGRVLAVVNMVLVKAGRESALSDPTGISYAVPVRHLIDLLKAR
jgi:S1-C subfamily serine protease